MLSSLLGWLTQPSAFPTMKGFSELGQVCNLQPQLEQLSSWQHHPQPTPTGTGMTAGAGAPPLYLHRGPLQHLDGVLC